MKGKHLSITGAATAMLILILDSRGATNAAAEALQMCIRTVIPALFPFFLLSGYITGSLSSGAAAKSIGRLFHMPEACGGILLTGILGGYPVGAKLAAQQYRSGTISRDCADRLLWFCSQAGPSFLFGMAAAQMGSSMYGWILWGIQILSALSVAWILPGKQYSVQKKTAHTRIRWNDAMRSSLVAMASVCGWVIVFSVVIQFMKRWFLWLLPVPAQILICGLLEITNGCLLLQAVDNMQLRFLLTVIMMNFGGLCVLMQTSSVADGLNLRGYFLGKSLQTAFALLYAMLWMGYWASIIPLVFIFSIRVLIFSRKSSSIPAKIGV